VVRRSHLPFPMAPQGRLVSRAIREFLKCAR
jgi:hypothetical protein